MSSKKFQLRWGILATGGIAESTTTQKSKGKRKARPEGEDADENVRDEDGTPEGSDLAPAGNVAPSSRLAF